MSLMNFISRKVINKNIRILSIKYFEWMRKYCFIFALFILGPHPVEFMAYSWSELRVTCVELDGYYGVLGMKPGSVAAIHCTNIPIPEISFFYKFFSYVPFFKFWSSLEHFYYVCLHWLKCDLSIAIAVYNYVYIICVLELWVGSIPIQVKNLFWGTRAMAQQHEVCHTYS